jgi:hypothetical protein
MLGGTMAWLSIAAAAAGCAKATLQSTTNLMTETKATIKAASDSDAEKRSDPSLQSSLTRTLRVSFPSIDTEQSQDWPELGTNAGAFVLYAGEPGVQLELTTRHGKRTGPEAGQWQEAVPNPIPEGASLIVRPDHWWALRAPQIQFIEGPTAITKYERITTLDVGLDSTAQVIFGSETHLLLKMKDQHICIHRNPSTGKLTRFELGPVKPDEPIIGFASDQANNLLLVRAQSLTRYRLDEPSSQIVAQTVPLAPAGEQPAPPEGATWVGQGELIKDEFRLQQMVIRTGTGLNAAYAPRPDASVPSSDDEEALPTTHQPSPDEQAELAAVSYTEDFWNTRMKGLAEAHCLPCHGAEASDRVWRTAHEFSGWLGSNLQLATYIEGGSMPKSGSPQEASLSPLDRKIMIQFAKQGAAQTQD